MRKQRWRWTAVPVFCCCALYLPVYADQFRYYYPTLPFLLAATLGMARWLNRGPSTWRRLRAGIACGLVLWIFSTPSTRWLAKTMEGGRDERVAAAQELARGLRRTGIEGAVAGDRGESLYVAFFLGQPWVGYRATARSPEVFATSGANLIVISRGGPLDEAFRTSPEYESLEDAGAAGKVHPFRVYRRRQRGSGG